jgi:hypothetical protein
MLCQNSPTQQIQRPLPVTEIQSWQLEKVQDEGLPVPSHCETVAAAAAPAKVVAGPLYITALAATTVQALNQNKESLLLQHKSPNPYASLKSLSLLRPYTALRQGPFHPLCRLRPLLNGPFRLLCGLSALMEGTFWSTS